jgi:microcystin degradation protein MlrC
VSAVLLVLREKRAQLGWEVIEGTYAFALPGGRVSREAYETLRDQILDQLRAALPVDFVALTLHGAMMAIGYDDCEGDLLTRIRSVVGPRVPIGAQLDPHAHLSEAMTDNADVLIAMREYPHTDFLERARELVDLLERTTRRSVWPVASVYDCAMIGRFHTFQQPMRSFVQGLARLIEQTPGLLTVSLIHGFPWGDVLSMGTKVLAIADGDQDLATRVAEGLGRQIWDLRGTTSVQPHDIKAGLDAALEGEGPVVVADVSDNPGGGAAGDSTILLRELLGRDVDACLGPLWDPSSVRSAFSAGKGAKLALRIGGKAGPSGGGPLEVNVEVLEIAPEALQSWAGTRVTLGMAASVRIGRVEVVLSSIRDQAYGPDLFSNLGVDPRSKRIVAVKSAQHFLAGFQPLARAVFLLSGGGPLEVDFRRIPYRHVHRPKWPLDETKACP